MNPLETRFLAAVQESHRRMLERGVRSTHRIRALHGWVMNELGATLRSDYELHGQSDDADSKEKSVDGWYYPKKVDVSVIRGEKVVGVVSVKFVNSNYKQNANNYFEQQMGETANLRRKNIVFGHIFCLTDPIPYYNKQGEATRFDNIRDADIAKYYKLSTDHMHAHAPDIQALVVLGLDVEERRITKICAREDLPHVSDEHWKMLERMDINRFFTKFVGAVSSKYDMVRDD